MTSPVIEAMARAMIAAEYGILSNQDSIPLSMERMRKNASFVLKALEENITDKMIEAGGTALFERGLMPTPPTAANVFNAMLRAAREE